MLGSVAYLSPQLVYRVLQRVATLLAMRKLLLQGDNLLHHHFIHFLVYGLVNAKDLPFIINLAIPVVKLLDVIFQQKEVVLEAAVLQNNILCAVIQLVVQLCFDPPLSPLCPGEEGT